MKSSKKILLLISIWAEGSDREQIPTAVTNTQQAQHHPELTRVFPAIPDPWSLSPIILNVLFLNFSDSLLFVQRKITNFCILCILQVY